MPAKMRGSCGDAVGHSSTVTTAELDSVAGQEPLCGVVLDGGGGQTCAGISNSTGTGGESKEVSRQDAMSGVALRGSAVGWTWVVRGSSQVAGQD